MPSQVTTVKTASHLRNVSADRLGMRQARSWVIMAAKSELRTGLHPAGVQLQPATGIVIIAVIWSHHRFATPHLAPAGEDNQGAWTFAITGVAGVNAVLTTNGTSVPSGATITSTSVNSTCGNATLPCTSTWAVSADAWRRWNRQPALERTASSPRLFDTTSHVQGPLVARDQLYVARWGLIMGVCSEPAAFASLYPLSPKARVQQWLQHDCHGQRRAVDDGGRRRAHPHDRRAIQSFLRADADGVRRARTERHRIHHADGVQASRLGSGSLRFRDATEMPQLRYARRWPGLGASSTSPNATRVPLCG